MSLNTQSPIPLYRQLADRLLAEIDAGVHAVAARIPSEHELAERFEIGRPTVRQATDLLVRRGKLERRRGSGTFVLAPTRSIDVFSLAGTSAALHKSDLDARLSLVNSPVMEPARSNLKSSTHVTHDQTVVGQLEFSRTDIDRIRIERVATVDQRPVMYETLWFNALLFPDLASQALADRSLSALVRDVYFLEPTSADQAFSVATANAEQGTRLESAIGTPMLRVYRQLHFAEHRGALHVEMICLTDRFEFSQTLYPGQTDVLQNESTLHAYQSGL